MGDFIKEAGTIIFLVIATWAVAFPVSVSFAYRPTPKKRAVADAFIRTMFFASLTGFFAGLIGTMHSTQYAFEMPEKWWHVLIVGVGESTNNLFIGVALIAICCLFLAIGETRNKAL